MRARLIVVLLVGVSCGRTGLFDEDGVGVSSESTPGPGDTGTCAAPRTACTRGPRPATRTREWLRGTCEADLFCLPRDARQCDLSDGQCDGHCVFLDFGPSPGGLPTTRVYGSCPACGQCTLTCGGVAGWECPTNCAAAALSPIGLVDSASQCFVN
jgi:hypothetical protein